MDFYISSGTLKKLDNTLLDYKKRILKDFYDIHNLDIDYQTYENHYLERTIITPKKDIDTNKCYAYIWKKHCGKVQCSRSQSVDKFCKKHINSKNYGTIDN